MEKLKAFFRFLAYIIGFFLVLCLALAMIIYPFAYPVPESLKNNATDGIKLEVFTDADTALDSPYNETKEPRKPFIITQKKAHFDRLSEKGLSKLKESVSSAFEGELPVVDLTKNPSLSLHFMENDTPIALKRPPKVTLIPKPFDKKSYPEKTLTLEKVNEDGLSYSLYLDGYKTDEKYDYFNGCFFRVDYEVNGKAYTSFFCEYLTSRHPNFE